MAQTRTVDEWLRSRSSNKFGTEHIRNDSILSVGQSKKNIYTDTRIEDSHDEDRGISITGFFKYGNQYKELHEEHIRNDSILTHVGQSKKNIYTDTRIENFHDEDRGISITGFFKYGNQYKELHEEHIRNGSILTHVGQSKKNIYTDTRIENFYDEDRGISITGFFKDGNQYKELHEDTVISFPFYEITFDILL